MENVRNSLRQSLNKIFALSTAWLSWGPPAKQKSGIVRPKLVSELGFLLFFFLNSRVAVFGTPSRTKIKCYFYVFAYNILNILAM